jgi:phosphopantothenoylcysteine decarboxylase
MARLILGVTGSVAAIKTPELLAALRRAGHDVRIVATGPALYFISPDEIDATIRGREPTEEREAPTRRILLRDEDEWPAPGYRRGDPVLHIELRNWADLLVVAPLDANTLAKFALGISDNFLSCLFRAWDFDRPVFLAPAMNTLMWRSPVTQRHLRQLLEDRAASPIPGGWTLDEAPEVFARHAPRIVLIPPQAKRLACGDVGIGAMADVVAIAAIVREWSDRAGGVEDR